MEVGKNAVSEAKRKSMEGFTPGGGEILDLLEPIRGVVAELAEEPQG